jgi:hypothetical protein
MGMRVSSVSGGRKGSTHHSTNSVLIKERNWLAKATVFWTVVSKSKSKLESVRDTFTKKPEKAPSWTHPSITASPKGRSVDDPDWTGPNIAQSSSAAAIAVVLEEKPPSCSEVSLRREGNGRNFTCRVSSAADGEQDRLSVSLLTSGDVRANLRAVDQLCATESAAIILLVLEPRVRAHAYHRVGVYSSVYSRQSSRRARHPRHS